MKHFVKKIELETKENIKVFDITEKIAEVIKESKLKEGHAVVSVLHTTVGIYINEGEARLLEDFVIYLNRIAPNIKGYYLHDDIAERDDCPKDEPVNGHSHIKSAFFSNPSVTIILTDGKIQLGRYQRILFAEFDGPCPRKHKTKRGVLISIIGE
jgi:secondary thiamine-phosphate synthase enzyme